MNNIKELLNRYRKGERELFKQIKLNINFLKKEELKSLLNDNKNIGYTILDFIDYKLDISFYDIIEEIFYFTNIERHKNDILSSIELRIFHIYRDLIRTLPKLEEIVIIDNLKFKIFIGKLKQEFYYYENISNFLLEFETKFFKN